MATHALQHQGRAGTALARWLVAGFAFGFLAVPIFHQGALALLHAAGLAGRAPYALSPTEPLGVPQLWSLAFWGGVWGLVFAMILVRLDGAKLVLAAAVLGAILPTLVAWFVVAPLKGQPMAAGGAPLAMMAGPIVNAAWGLGTGLGLAWLGRPRQSARGRRRRG